MEQHIPPQGDGDRAAIGTDLGRRCRQLGLESAVSFLGVKGVTKGIEQLEGAIGAGLGRVQRGDAACAGHRESSAAAFRLASGLREPKGEQHGSHNPTRCRVGPLLHRGRPKRSYSRVTWQILLRLVVI